MIFLIECLSFDSLFELVETWFSILLDRFAFVCLCILSGFFWVWFWVYLPRSSLFGVSVKSQSIHHVLSVWGNRMSALSTEANPSWDPCLPFYILCTGSLTSGTVSSLRQGMCSSRSFFPCILNPQLLCPLNYAFWCFLTIEWSFFLASSWFGQSLHGKVMNT